MIGTRLRRRTCRSSSNPVQARQHHVQEDQVVLAVEGARQAPAAVVDRLDRHAPRREELAHQLAQLHIVVDQQDREIRLGLYGRRFVVHRAILVS